MTGWLGDWLAGNGPVAAAGALAVLLGLRHSMDPDHLTAVATLAVSDPETGPRRAGALGLAWGVGHGLTLFLFGLPLVFFGRALPPLAHQAAELLVGVAIVLLAVRLLIRWRRGYFHGHVHEHDGALHSHPHFHESTASRVHPRAHGHRHRAASERSPVVAFGLGTIHGVGGSAGAGVLMVAALSTHVRALAALAAFAVAAAAAMAVASAGVGHLLTTGRRQIAGLAERAVPWFAVASLAIGIWYSLRALAPVTLWP